MPVSPQDFALWSRITGNPYPQTPTERMALAPQVYEFNRTIGRRDGPNVSPMRRAVDVVGKAALAAGAWEKAKGLISDGKHRLVVLDEISYAMTWKWIDTADVVATIVNRPETVSVILTGRDMPDEVIAVADTVTEMKQIKHAFEQKIVAKKGIDY